MAYRSNRDMRAAYLANEQKNRAAYERRKGKKSNGVNWVMVIVLLLVVLYFVKHRGGSVENAAVRPVASQSR